MASGPSPVRTVGSPLGARIDRGLQEEPVANGAADFGVFDVRGMRTPQVMPHTRNV
jgi:hypothetical protein